MVYPKPKTVSRTATLVDSLPGNSDTVTAIMEFICAAAATPKMHLCLRERLGN